MTYQAAEIDFSLWVQSTFVSWNQLMIWISDLGYPLQYLLIIAALFWCIDAKLGQRFAVLVLFSGALNDFLKRVFHLPRPFWVDSRILALGDPSTAFGLPSGHAQTATAWVLLPWLLKRWWVWLVVLSLIFMIGFSRIYLGAHFLSQVIAGWVVGFVLVVVFLKTEDRFLAWLKSKSLLNQLVAVSIVPAVLLVAGAMSILVLGDWQIPELWIQTATPLLEEGEVFDPIEFADVVAASSSLLGMAIGSVLLASKGGHNSSGTVLKRILRFPVGLACIAVILIILRLCQGALGIPDEPVPSAWLWQFVSTFLLIFSIFYPIPLILRKIKLSSAQLMG